MDFLSLAEVYLLQMKRKEKDIMDKTKKCKFVMYCRVGRKEDLVESTINFENANKKINELFEEWWLKKIKYSHLTN